MVGPKLLRSGHCQRGAHERCPHFAGIEIGTPWRRRSRGEQVLTLCICSCHTRCPLAGRETVTRETWLQHCVCPGAGSVQEQEERAEQRSEEMSVVLAELRREVHPTAGEIEARLRTVFLDRDEPPPPGLAGWARVVAASQARPGTRTLRLFGMGMRAVARGVKWARQPVTGAEASNRVESRKLYRAIVVVALMAALLTAAALRSSGWRRLASAGGAALAWLGTVWITALGTAVTEIARYAEDHPAAGDKGTPPSP